MARFLREGAIMIFLVSDLDFFMILMRGLNSYVFPVSSLFFLLLLSFAIICVRRNTLTAQLMNNLAGILCRE